MKNTHFLFFLPFCLLFLLCQCQPNNQQKTVEKIDKQSAYQILSHRLDSIKKIETPQIAIDSLNDLIQWGTFQLGQEDSSIAQLHLALGLRYYKNFQFQKAIKIYQKADTIWQHDSQRFSDEITDNYLNIASLLDDIGDYPLATHYCQQALSHFLTTNNTALIAETYQIMGIAAEHAQDSTNLISFDKALAVLALQDNPNRQLQADLWQNKGRALSNNHQDYPQSLSLFNKALTYYQAENDSSSIASTAIEMAKNYLHQGIYSNATNYANQALSIRESLKNDKSVECYQVLGEIAEAQQKPDSALFFYQKGLQSMDATFRNNDVLTNPSIDAKTFNRKIELIQLLGHEGGPLSIRGQKTQNKAYLEAALRTYQLADALVQCLRREMQDDQSKYFWNETASPIYKKAIDVAAQLWDLTQDEKYKLTILQFAERTKAPVLREGIADNQAKSFAGVPAAERQRERELRATIAILEKQMDNNAQTTAFLTKTRTQLYAFQDSLKTKYPTYARYLDATTQEGPLSINDLKSTQKQLSDTTLLIEYAFGETNVYQIAVSNTDFKVFKTPLTPDFYAQISRFIHSVSDFEAIKKDFNAASKEYAETSFDVYQRLLEQPLKAFNAQKTIKRIHLVLDNQLHLLPFKALTDCPVKGWVGDYTSHCLVQQYAFSSLFSCQNLIQKDPSVSTPFSTDFKLACFGLDFKDSTLWRRNMPKTGVIRKKNNVLVNAEPETKGIASQFNGRFYFNQTATKDTFLKVAPQYDVLHITTHGYPEGLVFQKKNATDSLNDIQIGDIYGMALHSRFTFLSACETGQGKITEAEGVMSLGRAFTCAGSQSVLMTLWSIPDGSTSTIAQNFYANCRQGIPKDIAEQRAEIDYLNNIKSDKQALPINWAALTIIGDMSPLEGKKSTSKWWIWGFLASFAVIGSVILFKR